jgi:hypothetical protein
MGLQPSASRTDPLVECSYAFDPSFEFERESVGEPARYGSAFHFLIAFLLEREAKMKKADKPSLPDQLISKAVQTWRLPPSSVRDLPGHVKSSFGHLRTWLRGKNEWNRDFLKNIPKGKLYVEKAFAINIHHIPTEPFLPMSRKHASKVTARELPLPTVDGHVYEDLEKEEIAMTVDLAVPGLTLDHKTGSNGDFSRPTENLQMRTQGLAGLALTGEPPILAVGHFDRRGLPKVYADQASRKELKEHARRLRLALARIGDGSLRPGPWCARCPARDTCPAQHAQLLDRLAELVVKGGLGEFLAADDASRALSEPLEIGRIHLLRSKLDAVSKIVQKELAEWVRGHPSELATRPDGKVLVFREKTMEWISKSSILEALGKVRGERELSRLRKLGVMRQETREELHAVND